jgi:N-acetylglucosaminyl-diphospho-decaprenol L-rhamnosyltransferase
LTAVTIVVVSYNSRLHLPACLSSVSDQEATEVEVIVVDNASTDGSPALVTSLFPSGRVVVNRENRGFAAAVNQGIALASGEFVLLLNPDAVLLPGTLLRLVEFLEMRQGTAAVGPRQWVDADLTWQWSVVPCPPDLALLLAGLPWIRRLGLERHRLSAHWALNRAIWRDEQPRNTRYLSGACLLLRRAALEEVGGLDEGYFLFLEDVDLCERLRAVGWLLYALPTAGVVHAGLGSVRLVPDRGQGRLLSSASHYLNRHGDPLARALWALMRAWRSRGGPTNQAAAEAVPAGPHRLTLHWPPIPGAAAYWVELAADPTFLHAAAGEMAQPSCSLPHELLALPQANCFFWRMAGVDAHGQLGRFTPARCERGFHAGNVVA